jgi:hypothetical protein
MLGKLRLTSQESEAFVLQDEGDEDLGCPDWAVVGKVLVPQFAPHLDDQVCSLSSLG